MAYKVTENNLTPFHKGCLYKPHPDEEANVHWQSYKSQAYLESTEELWDTLPELYILKSVKGRDVWDGRSVVLNWRSSCLQGTPGHIFGCHH